MNQAEVLAHWRERAACAGKPTEWWYSSDPALYLNAHRICEICPVIVECDEWATKNREHGIWAGRARKNGADPDVLVETRACEHCGGPFEWFRKRGHPIKFCSDDCRDSDRRNRHLAWDEANRYAGAPSMLLRGHGMISRYQAGCRCVACKRVSRVNQRKIRARRRVRAA